MYPVLCVILSAAVLLLGIKIYLLKSGMKELAAELKERLECDTNTLVTVSVRDKTVRLFASLLNTQLCLLNRQRRQYWNKNRVLKDAVTNISHDLRTPLTAVCGYLDLLENEDCSENAARYLACIKERTAALKELTDELFQYGLILSKDDSQPTESLCLNDVLEESIAAFYPALTKCGITPVIRIPNQKIMRRLNRTALSRVFGNILNNAVKYSGGDLSVALQETGEILFANTAAGLNAVQAGQLFDRFFSVDAPNSGTGLGLSIAKELTEQMGGKISARYENQTLTIRVFFANESPSSRK